MEKYKSGYYIDAVEATIPQILKDLEDLIEGFDDDNEKIVAMKILRKGLQKIYAGYMKLDGKQVSN